jgi:hypothetical protein
MLIGCIVTLALTFALLDLCASASAQVQAFPADHLTIEVVDTPYTLLVSGDIAFVAFGPRVLGPMAWAPLVMPGQEESTVGVSGMCATAYIPGVGITTYPVTIEATAATLGDAIASVINQIGTLHQQGAVVASCQASGAH